MLTKAKIASAGAALFLSAGLVGAGVTAAQAASGMINGCTVTSDLPYKSGDKIRGTGSAICPTTGTRTLFVELHREEWWWHPLVATGSDSGAKKSYWAAAQGCDDGVWHEYFTEAGFGGTEINSGKRGFAATC